MKVPPKRKGNAGAGVRFGGLPRALNESPSEKEGKSFRIQPQLETHHPPSMKVPPKRKGNLPTCLATGAVMTSLNESPSEKEGKSTPARVESDFLDPQ